MIPWNPVTSIAFRFSNSVTAVLTIIYDLQRRVITELFKNVGGLLTNLFLTVIERHPPDPPKVGEQVLNDKFTLTFQSP